MMDEETMAVLAIQLLALSCIAAALVVYLVCKANRRRHTYGYEHSADEFPALDVGTGRSVLLTSCDTLFGIQLALHLTSLGFRVFAGIKPPSPTPSPSPSSCRSEAEAILRAKLKQREAASTAALLGAGAAAVDRHPQDVVGASTFGTLVTVPLDVTREDSLHEAVEHVRRNLPAGEDGLWAVINTAGVCLKGKLEQQDSSQWETMVKVNLFGMLRAARTFMPLLKTKKGRLVTIGTGSEHEFGGGGGGAVVYHAARHAVAGASCCLNQEMAVHGVHVITIHTESVASEKLFALPKLPRCTDDSKSVANDRYVKVGVSAVPNYALNVMEEALLVANPKVHYYIAKPTGLSNYLSAIAEKVENIRKKKYYVERTA